MRYCPKQYSVHAGLWYLPSRIRCGVGKLTAPEVSIFLWTRVRSPQQSLRSPAFVQFGPQAGRFRRCLRTSSFGNRSPLAMKNRTSFAMLPHPPERKFEATNINLCFSGIKILDSAHILAAVTFIFRPKKTGNAVCRIPGC